MITVIIPALNEEKTITKVIQIAQNSLNVSEIIVVDDQSTDNTVGLALLAGAKILMSAKRGKGISMMEGVAMAKNETLAFLDADIITYPPDVIDILTGPILQGRADFVKSYFGRQAGRVTELVAKPLISLLYPDFPLYRQPLSGMIAGKKSFLSKIDYEDGYGVDIGILMDMVKVQARITEVNIGQLENRMHPLEKLGLMAKEVAATIMRKAISLPGPEDRKESQVMKALSSGQKDAPKMKIAFFNLDQGVLKSNYLLTAADCFGFKNKLSDILDRYENIFSRTKEIAYLFKGKSLAEIIAVADTITVMPQLSDLIEHLHARGFILGIISDGFDCVANHLKNKYGFDFTVANELEFSQSIATGEVKIPSYFISNKEESDAPDHCFQNALMHISRKYDIDLKNTLLIDENNMSLE